MLANILIPRNVRPPYHVTKSAYYGYSLGAWDSLPILGVERRLATAILLTGGVPPETSGS